MKTERNAEMQGDETTPNSGGFLSSIIPHKFLDSHIQIPKQKIYADVFHCDTEPVHFITIIIINYK